MLIGGIPGLDTCRKSFDPKLFGAVDEASLGYGLLLLAEIFGNTLSS